MQTMRTGVGKLSLPKVKKKIFWIAVEERILSLIFSDIS